MKIHLFAKLLLVLSFEYSYLISSASVDLATIFSDKFEFLKEIIIRHTKSSIAKPKQAMEELKKIILATNNLRSFSLDKPFFVLVSNDEIRLFRISEQRNHFEQIATHNLKYFNVTAVSVSAQKQLVAFANKDNDILLFDFNNDKFELVNSHLGNGHLANFMIFSPNGSRLAVINHGSDTVILYDTNNKNLNQITKIFCGLESGPLTALFSDSGNNIAILCKERETIQWFSCIENDWKLIKCIPLNHNDFTYHFEEDELIIDSQEYMVDNIKPVELNSPTVVSDSIPRDDKNIIEPVKPENIPLILETKNKVLTRTSRPLIRGKTIPHQKVQLFMNDRLITEVMSAENGNFKFRVKKSLPNGLYKLNASIQLKHIKINSEFINLRIHK